jgi:hypothetical protein
MLVLAHVLIKIDSGEGTGDYRIDTLAINREAGGIVDCAPCFEAPTSSSRWSLRLLADKPGQFASV